MEGFPVQRLNALLFSTFMILLLLGSARASGQYDGVWISSGPLLMCCQNSTIQDPSKRSCGPGNIKLTVLNDQATGETDRLRLNAFRNKEEAEKGMANLVDAGGRSVTIFGDASIEADGQLAISGAISKRGVFVGTIGGQPFSGKFKGDNFSGSLDHRSCAVKIQLTRTK